MAEQNPIDPEEADDVRAWLAGQGRTCPVCAAPAAALEAFAIEIRCKPIPGGGLDTSDFHFALVRCTKCEFKDGEVCLEDVGLRKPPGF